MRASRLLNNAVSRSSQPPARWSRSCSRWRRSTKKSQTFVLPSAARPWLIIALMLFFLSALCAILTNAPLSYEAAVVPSVKGRLNEQPPRTASAAAKDIALTRLKALDDAKKKNGFKGKTLIVAMCLEALAVGCVAVAVSIVL